MKVIDPNEPLAIIGWGCRFPGAANPEAYWQNITSGKGFIRSITEDYVGLGPVFDENPEAWNKTATRMGAPVEPFDFPFSRFRGMPPKALEACDYHMKFGLVAAQDAIDNAFSIEEKARFATRTFFAIGSNSYETPVLKYYSESELFKTYEELLQTPTFKNLTASQQEEFRKKVEAEYFKMGEKMPVEALVGSMSAFIASRIAKLNKFTGGHTAVDAACGSSLAAVEIAVKRLRAGTCDVAVAGGIGGIVPFFYVYCSKAKTMSAEGVFPFDVRASGFAVGEGAGFVVLKRLSDAVRDQNNILAVIRGVGASSDGSKTAPWAPTKEGQKLAVQRSLKQVPYGLSDLQYIECHGTGTRVGDIEEIRGICDLLPKEMPGKIAIGSAKGAVGHLLTGAGMAGLFRAILAMRNAQLPTTVNAVNLIPELLDPKFPLFVPLKTLPWPKAGSTPRRTMVNSFGFGGTNFNVLLEEFDSKTHSDQNNSNFVANPYQIRSLKAQGKRNWDDTHNVPIAIVGMAVRVPGAKSILQFKENLSKGLSFITQPPAERWKVEDFFSADGAKKWGTQSFMGGFVELPTAAEKLGWKIPPAVLPHIDPNQFRLFAVVKEALAAAGIEGQKDILQNTAMISANMMDSDFLLEEMASLRTHYLADFIRRNGMSLASSEREDLISNLYEAAKKRMHTFNGDNSTSGIDSMMASRVAKFFDIKGGSMSLDAVCATGALTVEQAVLGLRNREIDAAMVCSSNMGMSGQIFCSYNDLTALSPTNSLRPFDKNRDGMLLGEGACALVLQRLPEALASGRHIHGLIHTVSTSTDGLSGQMLSPEKATVKQAFETAIDRFGEDLSRIEMVECHGSGTVAGDRIEMECVKESYADRFDKKILMGSVKSSVGHMKVAAALASLIKTTLSLESRRIFPTVNHTNPDEFLLEHTDKLEVPTATREFKSQIPFASVNTMGLGGVNGHMVLSAYDPSLFDSQRKTFVMSANSLAELAQKVRGS